MTTHIEQLVDSLPEARRNRGMIANHEHIRGYIEQELLREHWAMGAKKPESLIVGGEGDMPLALPKHYHPFADWRATDGRGEQPIMRSWLGLYSLDKGTALHQARKLQGEIALIELKL